VSPDSRVVAGPLGPEQDILYADLDLELGVKMKLRHDFAGHYNRPDVFQLRVNAAPPHLFELTSEHADGIEVGTGDQPALDIGAPARRQLLRESGPDK
jgi:nitrilase